MAKIVSTLTFGSPLKAARRTIIIGAALTALLFGGLGTWAATAPLASTVLGSGRIVVSSNRQTIQHLEGGIILELNVVDGDTVAAGDVLMRMDSTQTRANRDAYYGQYLAASARKARLVAELNGRDSVVFPDDVLGAEGDSAEFVRSQINEFNARSSFLLNQELISREQQNQIKSEVVALTAQSEAYLEQVNLLKGEEESVAGLVKSGIETVSRHNALKRAVAEARGNYEEIIANIAQSGQRHAEIDARIIDLRNRMRNEVTSLLIEVEVQISDLTQRLKAIDDVISRVDIKAPHDGRIVNLQFHTIGGVIQPGQLIMDIVPSNDPLLIEASFKPSDIEVLRVGAPTSIRLSAYSVRNLPRITGTLISVSADSIVNQNTGQSFFVGRVEVDRTEIENLDMDIKLLPGMPADVMVLDHERTVLDYLINPIFGYVEEAFRES